MRAVTYETDGIAVTDVEKPSIESDADYVVKVSVAAICGSDLHLLSGKVPGLHPGYVLGHEFVGEVVEAGASAARWGIGQRVVGSFLIACGRCAHCNEERFNYCSERRGLGLGALAGDLAGAQADYVRVPNGDVNLLGVPDDVTDEKAIFCGDILSTALYAVRRGAIQKGAGVVILGAGPVGILCALCALAQGAKHVNVFDLDERRAKFARSEMGLIASTGEPAETIRIETNGYMADVVIDTAAAVGSLKSAMKCVRDGGRVVSLGAFGRESLDLNLGVAWVRGLELVFTGMGNVQGTWREAMELVREGRVNVSKLITHRMDLTDAPEAYAAFGGHDAMKVLLHP